VRKAHALCFFVVVTTTTTHKPSDIPATSETRNPSQRTRGKRQGEEERKEKEKRERGKKERERKANVQEGGGLQDRSLSEC